MARQDSTGAAEIYSAAGQWVDRCLRRDDSLFTPGHAIWSASAVQDLHARFVERPDESKRDFMAKFRDQLAGALGAPWEFKRLLFSVHGTAALLQQHALLHLAFPDTFEDIVSDEHKQAIANAKAYARHVTDVHTDVDRRLLEIRRGIEAEIG